MVLAIDLIKERNVTINENNVINNIDFPSIWFGKIERVSRVLSSIYTTV